MTENDVAAVLVISVENQTASIPLMSQSAVSVLRHLQNQLVAGQQPPHAAALERQGQSLECLRGGPFAGTDELVDEKGQRHAPGAAAGTGKEERCGHGEPR